MWTVNVHLCPHASGLDLLAAHWPRSHAWNEPVFRFVACLRRHAAARELDAKSSSYWVRTSGHSAKPRVSALVDTLRLAEEICRSTVNLS